MSRFVILYKGVNDPSGAEERELVSSLKGATVIDRTPGNILVDGAEAEVAAVVKSHKHWTFSPAGTVNIKPPRRVLKQPAFQGGTTK